MHDNPCRRRGWIGRLGKFVGIFLYSALSIQRPVFGVQHAAPAIPDSVLSTPDSSFEDPPASWIPRQPPSPEELDRQEALAWFATARSLELQGQDAQALQKYQRAHRLDPQAAEILEAIIPLAMNLNRETEAERYALLAADREETSNPTILVLAAERLADEGAWKPALKYYDRILTINPWPDQRSRVLLLLKIGRLAFLAEDYRRSAECYSQVMQYLEQPQVSEYWYEGIPQEPSYAYQIFGESFLHAEQYDAAESAFRKGNQFRSHPARLKYNLARLAARRGHPHEALALLDEAFAAGLTGFDATPYEELDHVLSALGKSEEFIPRLEKLRANDQENAPLGYFLAAQYRKAGKLDQADALYEALLKHSPTLIGYQSLAAIRHERKDLDGLLRVLGQVIDQTAFLDALGEEEQKLAQDGELLRALQESARKNLPPPPDKTACGPRLALALLALETKQWNPAEEFFEAAAQSDPDRAGQVYLDWGIGLLVAKQSARAEKVFRRAIERNYLPDHTAMLFFYLAGALSLEDRTDEALAAARRALELKIHQTFEKATAPPPRAGPSSAPATPRAALSSALAAWWEKSLRWLRDQFRAPPADSVRFLSRIGWVLAHGKRYDEALRAYRDVIEKFDPDYTSDRLREELKEIRLEAANAAVLAGRIPEAEEWLNQVLDEFPQDPGASNDLGYLWAERNQHLHRALRMTQTAVAAEPENPAFRDSLGWVLYRLGRTGEAIAELQRAAALLPDGEVLDHLGDAYHSAGRPADAQNARRKAAAAYRQDHESEKAEAVEKKIKSE
jgi:tetratricopeptide (TPR) repeat protein